MLSRGGGRGGEKGIYSFGYSLDRQLYQWLYYVILHPGLDNLLSARSITISKLNSWNKHKDYDFSSFYQLTSVDPTTLVY